MRRIGFIVNNILGLAIVLTALTATAADLPLEQIKLPPGFAIELWARVDNARQMARGQHDSRGGTLFVGSRQAGKVHAVRFGPDLQARGVTLVADDYAGAIYRITYRGSN